MHLFRCLLLPGRWLLLVLLRLSVLLRLWVLLHLFRCLLLPDRWLLLVPLRLSVLLRLWDLLYLFHHLLLLVPLRLWDQQLP